MKEQEYQADQIEALRNQKLFLKAQIKKMEEKNWYGIILICAVMALILILGIIDIAVNGLTLPVMAISILMICLHVILLILSKTDKRLAYIGGLVAYVFYYFLSILITETIMLKSIFWSIAIIGCYLIFIYDEIKLKRLRKELDRLNN